LKVRAALLTDITRIIIFCKAHEHILGEDDPHIQAGYLRRQLKQAVKANDQAIFITTRKNTLLGVIVCWIAPYIWNTQLYVTDILFVADQGGDRLMKAMEKWGKANGARSAAMQTHLAFDPRVEKLYSRKGFKKVGAVFEKAFTGVQ